MLADMGRVFPNDMWLAKASKLVNAAIAMNERSWLPAVTFMNGEPPEKWESFERRVFEIPGEHLTELFREASGANQDIIRRYMHNLGTMCHRLEDQAIDLNSAVSTMRQGDAFGSMLSMVGNLGDNPGQLLTQLTAGGDNIEGIAESLAQNPHIAGMVTEVADKVDLGKIMGMLPMLKGLQAPPGDKS
tara:strand:+ start:1894 stop:2457 length:564 start_codon:yes stop_codon:yes gene_type:complete